MMISIVIIVLGSGADERVHAGVAD